LALCVSKTLENSMTNHNQRKSCHSDHRFTKALRQIFEAQKAVTNTCN
jgi:hypothetical protein